MLLGEEGGDEGEGSAGWWVKEGLVEEGAGAWRLWF
jgi:hypothetical protein